MGSNGLRVYLVFALALLLSATLTVAVITFWFLSAYATATVFVVIAALVGIALWIESRRPLAELDYLISAIRGGALNTRVDVGSSDLPKEIDRALDALNARVFRAELEGARLEAIVAHVPSPLIELTERGTLRSLNDAARHLLPPVRSLEGLLEAAPSLGRALATIEPGPPALLRTPRSQGGKRWLLSAKTLRTPTERSTIISMQDVDTALVRTEFDAWRDLIRVVNHEIINVLTPISSLAQSSRRIAFELPGEIGGVTSLREVTESLEKRARALREFIHNYRGVSQLPTPQIETVRIDALLNALVRELDARATDVRFEFCQDTEPIRVAVDPSLLQQAVLNLLVNAADASRMSSSDLPVQVSVWLDDTPDDTQVVIEVRDHGPGVSEQAGERLFVPFFTTKPAGNGIGLSLVRQVCLAHRGTVEWENRDAPEGATFRMRLPTP